MSQRSLPMHLAELPSESELGEVDISRWLMTRRNVASYDCRSDVSAGLPGIAYVTGNEGACWRSFGEFIENNLIDACKEGRHLSPVIVVYQY